MEAIADEERKVSDDEAETTGELPEQSAEGDDEPLEDENVGEDEESGADAGGDGDDAEDDAEPAIEQGDETNPEEDPATGDDTSVTEGENREEPADGEEEDVEGEVGESPLPLASVVEAVLFAAREPIKIAQIARAVGKRTRQKAVRQAIEELNIHYLETARAFEIAEISGRYQLMSRPEYARHIMRIYPKKDLSEKEKSHRLTPTSLDTLAIIAYKQPVTRGEIEHIRGVACGSVLKTLIERGTVRVAGKRTDLVGQPRVYGTTEAFLAEFGLGSLDELPLRNDFLGILGDDTGAVELFPEAGESQAVPEEAPIQEPEAEPEPQSDAEATEIEPGEVDQPESEETPAQPPEPEEESQSDTETAEAGTAMDPPAAEDEPDEEDAPEEDEKAAQENENV